MAKSRQRAVEPPPCYALLIPGLEPLSEVEIRHELQGVIKRAGEGLLVFRAPHLDTSLLRLRTVEDIFLLAWGTDRLSHRAEDLERIRHWTAKASWQELLQIHHALRPKPKGKPTYHLVTQKTGDHAYRRIDAQQALARGLEGHLPASWRYAEENAAVEVWLTIQGNTAVCGLRLSDRTMRHRTYKLEHLPASLRPTLAAGLVQLADLEAGEVLLDPMCGAGTILAEGRTRARDLGLKGVQFWGGDLDRGAMRAADANLRRLGGALLARWDARRLPLADASVDCIVSNPPFGKQLGRLDEIGPLYRRMVREYDRVLRPGGRVVLLVGEQGLLNAAVQATAWTRRRHLRVRVLGQPAVVSLWKKD
jgi:23S rRNA G2445 N2-methylase RlmL